MCGKGDGIAPGDSREQGDQCEKVRDRARGDQDGVENERLGYVLPLLPF